MRARKRLLSGLFCAVLIISLLCGAPGIGTASAAGTSTATSTQTSGSQLVASLTNLLGGIVKPLLNQLLNPAQPGSPGYVLRDLQNIADAYGRQTAPDGQLSATYIQAATQVLPAAWIDQLMNQVATPTRLALSPGALVPGWNAGNPYRSDWAGKRGRQVSVTYTNRYGALIRGDLFAPLPDAQDPYSGAPLTGPYPGVVITTGSVQGSEHMYWWLAQDLAERGYLVLTYDVQGQGTSETLPHLGCIEELPYFDLAAPPLPGEMTPCPGVPFQQTANFICGTQDAISFFLSTPDKPWSNPGAGSAEVNGYNPLWELFDRSRDANTVTPGRETRLAIIGHSLGALAVSYLQGVDQRVEAVVALDKLCSSASLVGSLMNSPGPIKPVVPALAVQSEYGFNVAPYFANPDLFNLSGIILPTQAPDPWREAKSGYLGWKAAGVDTMLVVPRASTHLEYTDIPWVLPASRYGQDVTSYYTQAWLAKYLKHDSAADAALQATSLRYQEPVNIGVWKPVTLNRADRLSFYFYSGYWFRTAAGNRAAKDNLDGTVK